MPGAKLVIFNHYDKRRGGAQEVGAGSYQRCGVPNERDKSRPLGGRKY